MSKGKKQKPAWQGLLAGSLLTLGVYLAGLLLLTLLLVKGVLSEGGAFPAVAALLALAALAGGVLAVRLTGWPSGGVLSAAAVLAALALAGLGIWEEAAWLGRGGILILCGLAGGVLAGAAGRKKRRRRK